MILLPFFILFSSLSYFMSVCLVTWRSYKFVSLTNFLGCEVKTDMKIFIVRIKLLMPLVNYYTGLGVGIIGIRLSWIEKPVTLLGLGWRIPSQPDSEHSTWVGLNDLCW